MCVRITKYEGDEELVVHLSRLWLIRYLCRTGICIPLVEHFFRPPSRPRVLTIAQLDVFNMIPRIVGRKVSGNKKQEVCFPGTRLRNETGDMVESKRPPAASRSRETAQAGA